MRIIARKTLSDFWKGGHADAEQPLKAWFAEVRQAKWTTMADIKRRYPKASVVDRERVVFDIGGNKYRLVVKLWFPTRTVWIKFIGTHRQYNDFDVNSV